MSKQKKEVNDMANVFKAAIIVFVVIYIISPFDICPGPIDDVIVALMGLAIAKGNPLLK